MLTVNQMIIAVSNQASPNNAAYIACLSEVPQELLGTFLALSNPPIHHTSKL